MTTEIIGKRTVLSIRALFYPNERKPPPL